MKTSFATFLSILVLTATGFAQSMKVDVKEQVKDHFATNYQMSFHHDFEHDFNFEYDFNFSFEMPEFDFDFDFEMPEFDFSGLNNLNDYQGFWYEEMRSGADPRKENIRMVIEKDGYDSDTEVVIKNINGDVFVTGYDGDEIVIEGTKELWKKRGKISDEEAAEFELKTRMYEGKLYVYVDSPNAHVEFRKGKLDYHWHWDDNDRNRINAHYDLEIKIPKKLALNASTVNAGEVRVSNMLNGVKANNVNGSVLVKDVRGYITANTVNGDIEVWYLESPKEDTDFQTVNGTIEIYSPEDLSAVVTFQSLHGELYTDFEQIKRLPNRLNKEQRGDGYRYKINNTSPIQFGDGAIEMGFELVNGDVYIRTRKS
ncbi:MAG: DUF4097 family beta strand repeat-containing protein [Balneola sp.]